MIERFQNDKKFRNKISLIGYAVFIIAVISYSIANNSDSIKSVINNDYENKNEENEKIDNNSIINLFDKYDYSISVKINNDDYKFLGRYYDKILTINKEYNGNITKYLLKDSEYYLLEDNSSLDAKTVYDPVDYQYLDIAMINKYLSKAIYSNYVYKVYLKDILLGNTSDDYIVINYTSNSNNINIEIDYTNLLKNFNNDIEKYLVVMKYNKVID